LVVGGSGAGGTAGVVVADCRLAFVDIVGGRAVESARMRRG
jgi:hypothetical protein